MEIFNISESTAKRATRDLKKFGYIEREGSDKTGRWVILDRFNDNLLSSDTE